jgi:hypothetical protein
MLSQAPSNAKIINRGYVCDTYCVEARSMPLGLNAAAIDDRGGGVNSTKLEEHLCKKSPSAQLLKPSLIGAPSAATTAPGDELGRQENVHVCTR